MKVFIGFGRKEVVRGLVEVIACKPTTRLRDMSGAREKEVLLGINLERSYPPNVKLPKNPFAPVRIRLRTQYYLLNLAPI